ncbi:unnamed protein product [Parascedosporium putredinis]|uniref:Rhodopsin domain-containing protein n=1 Tax=Parascedosporium putredinis TaxID=1442378 RepID=A0A9P1M5H6_9PEZI|nr:unnamed protein product [Parascedosporium putredinis]CAI7988089.1 unnamed protein product [Parascedosporium putredinis]
MGTGVEPPLHNDWLHRLATAITLITPCLTAIVVSLRVGARAKRRILGVVSLAKSSVLFFLLARGSSRLPFRVTCHIINVFILLAMATILFTTIFQCLPVRRAWEGPGVGAQCINRPLLRLARTCWTMATDVAVLVLALWAYLERRMTRSTRAGIAGALAIGAVALGASIAQLYLLLRYTASEDAGAPGRVGAFVWIIMPIEASLVIIAASVPTLQALCPSRFPPPLPRVEEPSTSQSTSDHDLSRDITIHHIPKDVYPSDSSLMAKSMRGIRRSLNPTATLIRLDTNMPSVPIRDTPEEPRANLRMSLSVSDSSCPGGHSRRQKPRLDAARSPNQILCAKGSMKSMVIASRVLRLFEES